MERKKDTKLDIPPSLSTLPSSQKCTNDLMKIEGDQKQMICKRHKKEVITSVTVTTAGGKEVDHHVSDEDTEYLVFDGDENDDDYLSEYEYEYNDSDMDEEQQTTTEFRNDRLLKAEESKEMALKALITTDDKFFNTHNASPYSRAVGGAGIASYCSPQTCHSCGRESHIPLSSCTVASQWIQRGKDEGGGFMMLPQHLLPFALSGRIRECATRFGISEDSAEKYLTIYNWDLERLQGNIPVLEAHRKLLVSTRYETNNVTEANEKVKDLETENYTKYVELEKKGPEMEDTGDAANALDDARKKEAVANFKAVEGAKNAQDLADTRGKSTSLSSRSNNQGRRSYTAMKAEVNNEETKMMVNTSDRAIRIIQRVQQLAKSLLMDTIALDDMFWLAERFVKKQVEFAASMKDSSIRIGFHNTKLHHLESIRMRELLPSDGIYTHNNALVSTVDGEIGMLVAVLVGNTQRIRSGEVNKPENKDQCIPLIIYPTSSVLEYGPGSLRVLECQQKLEKLLGDIFNNDEEEKMIRVCDICMDNENQKFYEMQCGHSYCRECWQSYLHVMFEQHFGGATLLITCPEVECRQTITSYLIQEVVPELLPIFEQQKLHSFVSGNHTSLRLCPGPECNQIAVRLKENMFLEPNNAVFCRDGCRTRFCFLCGGAPHDGLCFRVEQQEAETKDKLPKSEMIQTCPKCKTLIEKNGGCNHMRCKCGFAFCWICRSDLSVAPYNHSCGRFRPVRERSDNIDLNYLIDSLQEVHHDNFTSILVEISEESRRKERFAHYYNRFVTHAQGQCFAERQCSCVQARASDYYTASGIKTATDIDFLFDANKCLVQCRRVLKYSYCYIYHITNENQDVDNVQLGLFEDHLERLERFTEKLSEASEGALTPADRKRVLDLTLLARRCLKTMNELGYEVQVKPITESPSLKHKIFPQLRNTEQGNLKSIISSIMPEEEPILSTVEGIKKKPNLAPQHASTEL